MSSEREFIERYDSARDRSRIAFAWNGQHAEQFQDANEAFRCRVVNTALTRLATVSLELIRDLYDAETAWAAQAWCVKTKAVSAFAQELLTRGGAAFVEDFLAGKIGRGMDAFCAANFDCPRQLTEQLLAEIEHRLATDVPEERRTLLESGHRLFRTWLESAAN